MIRFLLLALLLNACSTLPKAPGCSEVTKACDALIEVQEARYTACEMRVERCTKNLEATSPDLITKLFYGVAGLALGLVLGSRAVR